MFIQKVKKGWKELDEDIIQTGKCVFCGACGAFCANINYDMVKEIPVEDGSCKEVNTCRDGYGLCYNICPKTENEMIPLSLLDKWVFGIKQDKILGHYIVIKTVRLTDHAKENLPEKAGPITGLLQFAMEEGLIDASLVTESNEDFKPLPLIAENKKDLRKGIGYKPSQSPTLSKLGDAINKGYTDIAVVGTPCQIQSLRKLQNHPNFDFEAYDLVSLAISTFCFGTFRNVLLDEILKENKVNPSNIKEISTSYEDYKMKVVFNSDSREFPLNQLYEKAIRQNCFSCSDYTGSFSDISIGKVGSDNDWRTVIIRTEKGKNLIDLAVDRGILEVETLDDDSESLILDITRSKTYMSKIISIEEHSPEIKSFSIRNRFIADAYRPGMFVMVWLPNIDFFPMSISNVNGSLLEITVQRIGEGTSSFFDMNAGDTIGIRGPFGNTWNYEDASNILVVGGGMGIAAVMSLIEPLKQNMKNVTVTIGAKDEASLIFADRLIELIPKTMCSTDDGSMGMKCFVTDTIEGILNENSIDLIITCGPEVMMKKVLEIADSKNIKIQASLERKMKCGVGLCGSCCIGENNDVCVCKDGPIFTSEKLRQIPQFGNYVK